MCIEWLVDFLFYIGHTGNLLYVKGTKMLKTTREGLSALQVNTYT
jgi:hypothetical protein